MKGRNAELLRLTRNLFIAVLLILICTTSRIYATDVSIDAGNTTEPIESANLPYIEMKVKAIKVGESNQILVEMWGSNFTNFEAMEFVFTYNNTKLTPSNVSDNEIINNLDLYKYEKRPTQAGDKPTDLELLEQLEFDNNSTEVLSKAFNFEDEYTSLLGIDLFRYLAPAGNNEAMQFIMSKKNEDTNISATDPVCLGKFSFIQTEETILDETELATSRIKVSCDDGVTEGEESYYVRDVVNGENCEEIVEFTYEKYGSISGKISASILSEVGKEVNFNHDDIPIATIKIYKKEDVKDIEWSQTGTKYVNCKRNLKGKIEPELEKIECAVTPYTTTAEDEGVFKLENIEFGEYVLLIDKDYYADVIITNIVIDSTNKDIDLVEKLKDNNFEIDNNLEIIKEGTINLIPGDIDNDGVLSSTKDPKMYKEDSQKQLESEVDFNDKSVKGMKNDFGDAKIFKRATQIYKGNQTIKSVISL